jgi:hypothetical protein
VDTPSRTDALALLEKGWIRLHQFLGRLPNEDMVRRGTIGGGEWSAKDLLGHIATWEDRALQVIRAWRGGEPLPPPEETDAFNARTVAEKEKLPLAQVRSDSARTHQELVESIAGLSDEEWTAAVSRRPSDETDLEVGALVGRVTAAQDRLFGHAFDHLPDLEAFVSSLG